MITPGTVFATTSTPGKDAQKHKRYRIGYETITASVRMNGQYRYGVPHPSIGQRPVVIEEDLATSEVTPYQIVDNVRGKGCGEDTTEARDFGEEAMIIRSKGTDRFRLLRRFPNYIRYSDITFLFPHHDTTHAKMLGSIPQCLLVNNQVLPITSKAVDTWVTNKKDYFRDIYLTDTSIIVFVGSQIADQAALRRYDMCGENNTMVRWVDFKFHYPDVNSNTRHPTLLFHDEGDDIIYMVCKESGTISRLYRRIHKYSLGIGTFYAGIQCYFSEFRRNFGYISMCGEGATLVIVFSKCHFQKLIRRTIWHPDIVEGLAIVRVTRRSLASYTQILALQGPHMPTVRVTIEMNPGKRQAILSGYCGDLNCNEIHTCRLWKPRSDKLLGGTFEVVRTKVSMEEILDDGFSEPMVLDLFSPDYIKKKPVPMESKKFLTYCARADAKERAENPPVVKKPAVVRKREVSPPTPSPSDGKRRPFEQHQVGPSTSGGSATFPHPNGPGIFNVPAPQAVAQHGDWRDARFFRDQRTPEISSTSKSARIENRILRQKDREKAEQSTWKKAYGAIQKDMPLDGNLQVFNFETTNDNEGPGPSDPSADEVPGPSAPREATPGPSNARDATAGPSVPRHANPGPSDPRDDEAPRPYVPRDATSGPSAHRDEAEPSPNDAPPPAASVVERLHDRWWNQLDDFVAADRSASKTIFTFHSRKKDDLSQQEEPQLFEEEEAPIGLFPVSDDEDDAGWDEPEDEEEVSSIPYLVAIEGVIEPGEYQEDEHVQLYELFEHYPTEPTDQPEPAGMGRDENRKVTTGETSGQHSSVSGGNAGQAGERDSGEATDSSPPSSDPQEGEEVKAPPTHENARSLSSQQIENGADGSDSHTMAQSEDPHEEEQNAKCDLEKDSPTTDDRVHISQQIDEEKPAEKNSAESPSPASDSGMPKEEVESASTQKNDDMDSMADIEKQSAVEAEQVDPEETGDGENVDNDLPKDCTPLNKDGHEAERGSECVPIDPSTVDSGTASIRAPIGQAGQVELSQKITAVEELVMKDSEELTVQDPEEETLQKGEGIDKDGDEKQSKKDTMENTSSDGHFVISPASKTPEAIVVPASLVVEAKSIPPAQETTEIKKAEGLPDRSPASLPISPRTSLDTPSPFSPREISKPSPSESPSQPFETPPQSSSSQMTSSVEASPYSVCDDEPSQIGHSTPGGMNYRDMRGSCPAIVVQGPEDDAPAESLRRSESYPVLIDRSSPLTDNATPFNDRKQENQPFEILYSESTVFEQPQYVKEKNVTEQSNKVSATCVEGGKVPAANDSNPIVEESEERKTTSTEAVPNEGAESAESVVGVVNNDIKGSESSAEAPRNNTTDLEVTVHEVMKMSKSSSPSDDLQSGEDNQPSPKNLKRQMESGDVTSKHDREELSEEKRQRLDSPQSLLSFEGTTSPNDNPVAENDPSSSLSTVPMPGQEEVRVSGQIATEQDPLSSGPEPSTENTYPTESTVPEDFIALNQKPLRNASKTADEHLHQVSEEPPVPVVNALVDDQRAQITAAAGASPSARITPTEIGEHSRCDWYDWRFLQGPNDSRRPNCNAVDQCAGAATMPDGNSSDPPAPNGAIPELSGSDSASGEPDAPEIAKTQSSESIMETPQSSERQNDGPLAQSDPMLPRGGPELSELDNVKDDFDGGADSDATSSEKIVEISKVSQEPVSHNALEVGSPPSGESPNDGKAAALAENIGVIPESVPCSSTQETTGEGQCLRDEEVRFSHKDNAKDGTSLTQEDTRPKEDSDALGRDKTLPKKDDGPLTETDDPARVVDGLCAQEEDTIQESTTIAAASSHQEAILPITNLPSCSPRKPEEAAPPQETVQPLPQTMEPLDLSRPRSANSPPHPAPRKRKLSETDCLSYSRPLDLSKRKPVSEDEGKSYPKEATPPALIPGSILQQCVTEVHTGASEGGAVAASSASPSNVQSQTEAAEALLSMHASSIGPSTSYSMPPSLSALTMQFVQSIMTPAESLMLPTIPAETLRARLHEARRAAGLELLPMYTARPSPNVQNNVSNLSQTSQNVVPSTVTNFGHMALIPTQSGHKEASLPRSEDNESPNDEKVACAALLVLSSGKSVERETPSVEDPTQRSPSPLVDVESLSPVQASVVEDFVAQPLQDRLESTSDGSLSPIVDVESISPVPQITVPGEQQLQMAIDSSAIVYEQVEQAATPEDSEGTSDNSGGSSRGGSRTDSPILDVECLSACTPNVVESQTVFDEAEEPTFELKGTEPVPESSVEAVIDLHPVEPEEYFQVDSGRPSESSPQAQDCSPAPIFSDEIDHEIHLDPSQLICETGGFDKADDLTPQEEALQQKADDDGDGLPFPTEETVVPLTSQATFEADFAQPDSEVLLVLADDSSSCPAEEIADLVQPDSEKVPIPGEPLANESYEEDGYPNDSQVVYCELISERREEASSGKDSPDPSGDPLVAQDSSAILQTSSSSESRSEKGPPKIGGSSRSTSDDEDDDEGPSAKSLGETISLISGALDVLYPSPSSKKSSPAKKTVKFPSGPSSPKKEDATTPSCSVVQSSLMRSVSAPEPPTWNVTSEVNAIRNYTETTFKDESYVDVTGHSQDAYDVQPGPSNYMQSANETNGYVPYQEPYQEPDGYVDYSQNGYTNGTPYVQQQQQYAASTMAEYVDSNARYDDPGYPPDAYVQPYVTNGNYMDYPVDSNTYNGYNAAESSATDEQTSGPSTSTVPNNEPEIAGPGSSSDSIISTSPAATPRRSKKGASPARGRKTTRKVDKPPRGLNVSYAQRLRELDEQAKLSASAPRVVVDPPPTVPTIRMSIVKNEPESVPAPIIVKQEPVAITVTPPSTSAQSFNPRSTTAPPMMGPTSSAALLNYVNVEVPNAESQDARILNILETVSGRPVKYTPKQEPTKEQASRKKKLMCEEALRVIQASVEAECALSDDETASRKRRNSKRSTSTLASANLVVHDAPEPQPQTSFSSTVSEGTSSLEGNVDQIPPVPVSVDMDVVMNRPPVTEAATYGDTVAAASFTLPPLTRRGRGRPKGSKSKTDKRRRVNTQIDVTVDQGLANDHESASATFGESSASVSASLPNLRRSSRRSKPVSRFDAAAESVVSPTRQVRKSARLHGADNTVFDMIIKTEPIDHEEEQHPSFQTQHSSVLEPSENSEPVGPDPLVNGVMHAEPMVDVVQENGYFVEEVYQQEDTEVIVDVTVEDDRFESNINVEVVQDPRDPDIFAHPETWLDQEETSFCLPPASAEDTLKAPEDQLEVKHEPIAVIKEETPSEVPTMEVQNSEPSSLISPSLDTSKANGTDHIVEEVTIIQNGGLVQNHIPEPISVLVEPAHPPSSTASPLEPNPPLTNEMDATPLKSILTKKALSSNVTDIKAFQSPFRGKIERPTSSAETQPEIKKARIAEPQGEPSTSTSRPNNVATSHVQVPMLDELQSLLEKKEYLIAQRESLMPELEALRAEVEAKESLLDRHQRAEKFRDDDIAEVRAKLARAANSDGSSPSSSNSVGSSCTSPMIDMSRAPVVHGKVPPRKRPPLTRPSDSPRPKRPSLSNNAKPSTSDTCRCCEAKRLLASQVDLPTAADGRIDTNALVTLEEQSAAIGRQFEELTESARNYRATVAEIEALRTRRDFLAEEIAKLAKSIEEKRAILRQLSLSSQYMSLVNKKPSSSSNVEEPKAPGDPKEPKEEKGQKED
ncbi:hypothetical protein QR680_004051 [Steinernema hermaphroditum]|uniref:Uncharacterized protein n=1 Tax=Steinernema hermaphroditum TaxID=289476 RepID=A0AA39LTC9_9BILA|nr:hypothetical protein QR680_004051 [Steinernema hermaphroditum]